MIATIISIAEGTFLTREAKLAETAVRPLRRVCLVIVKFMVSWFYGLMRGALFYLSLGAVMWFPNPGSMSYN